MTVVSGFYAPAPAFYNPAPEFYSGSAAVATEVPFGFSVALAGRAYLIDLESGRFRRGFEPRLRDNADTGAQTGENTATNAGLWRRSQTSWHRGAGQKHADHPNSDPDRYYRSRRVDPWVERGEIRLLRSGALLTANAAADQDLVTVGPTAYWSHGTGRDRVDNGNPPTLTALTAATGTITSMATDGRRVWFAQGDANVIQVLTFPSNTITSWTSGATPGATLVGYGKGRVLAARTNGAIFDISGTPPVAFPAAHFTHPSGAEFVWVAFADGPNHVYAAGYVGNRSHIYRMTLNAAGTALDQPVECGALSDGERIRTVEFYGGLMFLGTDGGVRVAQIDGAGDLVIGALIPTRGPVLDFEGEGPFVWFTNTNIDGSGTSGLGRLDPRQFFPEGFPAYANDVEGGNADTVTGVASLTDDGATVDTTFGVFGKRIWCQSTEGLFVEQTTPATTGELETGWFRYGLPTDEKLAIKADVLTKKTTAGPTVDLAVTVDDDAYTAVGSHAVNNAVSNHQVGERRGFQFGLKLTLNAASNVSPEVRQVELHSFPAPDRGEVGQVPIMLGARVADIYAIDRPLNVRDEIEFLRSLAREPDPVLLQEATVSETVIVEDVEWQPESWQGDEHWDPWWNGVALVTYRKLLL